MASSTTRNLRLLARSRSCHSILLHPRSHSLSRPYATNMRPSDPDDDTQPRSIKHFLRRSPRSVRSSRSKAEIAELESIAKHLDRPTEALDETDANTEPAWDDWDSGDYSAYAPDETAELEPEERANGFFAEDEEMDDPGEDPEFQADDISSLAHGELEQVRELREMLKVAAWDMPMLAQHQRAFEPASKEHVLRFRYTSYLGENHPGSKKVVVQFTPSALAPLADDTIAQNKLIKLLSTRYDPGKNEAKLGCDRFATVAQNKRYLGDMVDKLIANALDKSDTFEDVPFDFRHYDARKKPTFPEAWKMTEERTAQLAARREEAALLEERKVQMDTLVDGRRVVEGMMKSAMQRESVMAAPQVGQRQQGKARRQRA